MSTKTANDLIKEFGTRYPTLEAVAARFLGMTDKKTIYREHAQGKIPIPAFRLVESNKAPLLVDMLDFAKYTDEKALSAKENMT